MTYLVFGKTGQVATELAVQSDKTLCLGRYEANLIDPTACAAAILKHKPRAVINAAAFTAVDLAEQEEAEAQIINADAPGAMARACADLNIPFLHISTDYVFAGGGKIAWFPNDPVDPQNAYGRTKLAGEIAVRNAGGSYAILRTSWVFSAHGANFVKTMLRLSETRDALNVVSDQIGGPTPASGIAAAVLRMADAMVAGQGGGIYHYSGAPATSWECFARETFACAGRDVTVSGIPTVEYPTPANRPLNSRLDCSSLQADFDIAQPDWQAALAKDVKVLTA